MASFFWQATFPVPHMIWVCGSMTQKFPCSLQSIVPCGLVMLWLGRHPIPSLPPPWQMLFPGMLIASKENVKLKALASGHPGEVWRKQKLKWSSSHPTTNKAHGSREKISWQPGWVTDILEIPTGCTSAAAFQSQGSLPSPRTISKGKVL